MYGFPSNQLFVETKFNKIFYIISSSSLAGNKRELSPKGQLHDNCLRWWHHSGVEDMRFKQEFS